MPNFYISKLYIKWDEKIDLWADEIAITKSKKSGATSKKNLIKSLEIALSSLGYFENIYINKLRFNDHNFIVNYNFDLKTLDIDSDIFILSSDVDYVDKNININIKSLYFEPENMGIKGRIVANFSGDVLSASDLEISIKDELLKAKTYSINDKLYYLASGDGELLNHKDIVKILSLDDELKYWIDDAIMAKSVELETLSGFVDFNEISNAYKNLYAKANVYDATYIYDPLLDGIKSKKVALEFRDGVLHIDPQNAKSYGFDLAKSHLNIDFNNFLLTLWLDFEARLDENILALLKHYEIELPIKQLSGSTKTDLVLKIDLQNLDVKAKGVFEPKDSKIEYLAHTFDVQKAKVDLVGTHIKTDKFLATFEDKIFSSVEIDLDIANNSGKIALDATKFNLADLTLKTNPLKATYHITPNGDNIEAQSSSWNYNGEEILVDEIKNLSFDINTYEADLKPTFVRIKDYTAMMLSGKINFETKKAALEAKLIRSELGGIKLLNDREILDITYDKSTTISSKEPIPLEILGYKSTLSRLNIALDDNGIRAKNISIFMNDLLSAKFDMTSDQFSTKLHLNDIKIFDGIYKNSDGLDVDIKKISSGFMLSSSGLFKTFIGKNETSTKIDNLANLTKHSPKYGGLKKGDILIQTQNLPNELKFNINIKDTYAILTHYNELLTSYVISGTKKDDKTSLSIDDKIYMDIGKDIRIKAHDVGLNMLEFLDMLDRIKDDEQKSSTKIVADATNSYIYISPDRFIISDSIKAITKNDWLSVTLKHKNGEANLKFRDKNFQFYGDGFGGEFMSKLFAKSKFEKGVLKFSMSGLSDDFSGIIYAQDTILHDYKVLNNILAFINTIPSLFTFSLPGYSSKGLNIQNSYIQFHYKDQTYNISDFYLKSKEIQMQGKGRASVLKNSIDMDLSLKSDIGSAVSKIPIVGYILMGNDTVSTTLKLDGKLDDPTIHTQIAKDIMVAPINIIKRTLMLPFGGSDD